MMEGPKNGMWPSPFNQSTGNWGQGERKIHFADCTLRDGEQQAGIVLDRQAKVEIARLLDALGVYEIESGTVASSDEDRAAIKAILDAGLNAKISVLCRGMEKDIDLAAAVGAWGVRLSFPISQLEREYKLKGMSDAAYLDRAKSLTGYAKSQGLAVIFSPYDTTRADPEFLAECVRALQDSGTVDRLRIVDTTGCALPEAITCIVTQIRTAAPALPLEIHCHNDFGLACANTLAGIRAGADYVSSTINGLGERCGNAATEDVAMALEVLENYRTGLRLDKFRALSQRVAELSSIPVAVNKAVVGDNAFRHEAGMVVAGVLKNSFTAESYKPEIVGQQRDILLGKKSGLVSITYKLKNLGLSVAEGRDHELLDKVKEISTQRRRALTDSEFRDIVADMSS